MRISDWSSDVCSSDLTVSSVEFFLAVAVSLAFIWQLGTDDILGPTLGLIIGGAVAAPTGAMLANRFSPKVLLMLFGTVLTAPSAFGLYKVLVGWRVVRGFGGT